MSFYHGQRRRHTMRFPRLSRIRINRKVWLVAGESRIHDTRVKTNYNLFHIRAESLARALRLPNQSAADIYNDPQPPSCTNYWRKHWSAELQGAAVTCYYIPTGRCHNECDTMLCSKFRLQIKTGPNHCNLVIFFSFSRNLEHCWVPNSSWRRPK